MKAHFPPFNALRARERPKEDPRIICGSPPRDGSEAVKQKVSFVPPPLTSSSLGPDPLGSISSKSRRRTRGSTRSKCPSKFASFDDCPQEIIDYIFSYHSPLSQPILKATTESINELTELMSWLLQVAPVNRKWSCAIVPLLRSTARLSTNIKHLPGQISFAQRNSSTIRRLVLDCRYPCGDSNADRNRIIVGFQECLAACTRLQILDIIYLNQLLWDHMTPAKQLTSSLLSGITSNNLHSIAIVSTNTMAHHILGSLPPQVVRTITDLEIQTYTGTNSTTHPTKFPSMKRLTLTHVIPQSFSELYNSLFVMTESNPGRESSSITELSLTSTYVGLPMLVDLLNINNIGAGLLYLHFEVRWMNPRKDFARAPGTILRLCPRLETFHFFAPCPTSTFNSIPSSLLELGVLIVPDAKLSAISDVDTIVQWSNDSARRRNVRKLVARWSLDDHRKRRDQRMFRRSTLGVELFFVE
ncbi:hypothetical protein BDN72DRAFT_956187 [Pluteus cervinus]|uniref:Uncharacterized protein n=1 Tax=Pluteus cervinus TaxID=181527 RepID=A0ACD3B6Z0_9AGAR|nr:hypothetical protein BDN72DRAFT_956187 [Pluteus cervinus]